MDIFLEYWHDFFAWWEGLHSNIVALILSIPALISGCLLLLLKLYQLFFRPKPKQEQPDYSASYIKLLEKNSEHDQAVIEQGTSKNPLCSDRIS